MPTDEIDFHGLIRWLDSITDLDASEVQRELGQWSGLIQFWPEHRGFADAVLRLFERFPDRFGANGTLFLGNTFVYMLPLDSSVVESFLRKPSAGTTALLVWWSSDGDLVVDGYDLRRLLHDLGENPRAPRVAREIAAEWLEPDPDRHPALTDPALPVPTEDEIFEWKRRAQG